MIQEIAPSASRPTAPETRSVIPSKGQPGTLGEQLAAIVRALQLANHYETPASEQWDRAQEDVQRGIR